MHRFFAPSFDLGDEMVVLPREESEHLSRVLRLSVGTTVGVFDGRGHEFLARIVTATPREARVQLLTRVEPPPEPVVRITLAQAVLKGDKMDDIVRDAVMLGVAAIQPLVTKRAETTVAAVRAGRLDRWRRIALASAKQCGRAVVPEIVTPLSFETYLDDPPPALRLMLVEPGAPADLEALSVLRREPVPTDVAIWIGPEGGWDEAEWTLGRTRGARLMSLGHRTLRADAVPIVAVSVLQFLWES